MSSQQKIYKDLRGRYLKCSDPWHFRGSVYERDRFTKTIALAKTVPHKSILEAGCAEGDFTKMLTKISKNVVGFDLSKEAVARAKRNAPQATYKVHTLDNFKSQKRFDLIICAETLYYIVDKKAAIEKMRALGRYLLTSHFLFYPPGILAELTLMQSSSVKLLRREWHFTPKEIKACAISLWDLHPAS